MRQLATGNRASAISPGPTDISGIIELFGEENVASRPGSAPAPPSAGWRARRRLRPAVAFLASPDSSYMLGADLYVGEGENEI